MITWRTYAWFVAVSAGIAVTGSLWHSRRSPVLRGEDLAAITAGVTERSRMAYLSDSELSVCETNFVYAPPDWKTIYNDGLAVIRSMSGSVSNVMWINSEFEDIQSGDYLIIDSGVWTNSYTTTNIYDGGAIQQIEYQWEYSVTSHADQILLTSSLKPEYGIHFPLGTASNISPLSAYIFSQTNSEIDCEYTNWWNQVGNGTNNMQWPCESEPVFHITSIGAGFINSNPEDFKLINSGDSHSFSVQSIGTNDYRWLAQLYTISRKNVADHYCVIADNGISLSNNVMIGNPVLHVSEGGSVIGRIYLRDAFSSTQTVSISIISPSGGFSFLSAPNFIPSGETYYEFEIGSSADEDSVDNAGLIYFQIGDYPIQYFAVIQTDSSSDSELSILTSGMISKGAAKTFTVNLLTNLSPDFAQNRLIRTNDLDAAVNCMSNMSQTICIIPASSVAASFSGSSWSGSTDTNQSAWTEPPESASSVWGSWSQIIPSMTDVPVSSWDGYLLQIGMEFYGSLTHWYDSPEWWYFHYSFESSFQYVNLTNCTLPYPSDYSVTNGYVSRIRIYAAARETLYDNVDYGVIGNWFSGTNTTTTFSGSMASLSANDDQNFGLIDYVSSDPSISPSYSSTRYDWYRFPDYCRRLRLSELADVSDPSEPVSFSIGASALSPETIAGDHFSISTDDGQEVESAERYIYSRNILIDYFVVVVDWNWRFFGNSDYDPEIFSPEWTTNSLEEIP